MMEDDFNNLLSAVADVFDVPKSEVCRKYSQRTAKARDFMCHLIQHGMIHVRDMLFGRSDITIIGYYKSAVYADDLIHKSADDLFMMNEIRARLGLPRLKHAVTHKDVISDTKTLFGFDYSEYDIRRRRAAIRSSAEYMRGLCKIGRKPIPDGRVFSPLRKQATYDSWYNG